MENLPIAEYTVAAVAIIALVWVVRAFLSHLKKKDEVFTNTINNHLHTSVETQQKLIGSHDKLSDVIERLLNKL